MGLGGSRSFRVELNVLDFCTCFILHKKSLFFLLFFTTTFDKAPLAFEAWSAAVDGAALRYPWLSLLSCRAAAVLNE